MKELKRLSVVLVVSLISVAFIIGLTACGQRELTGISITNAPAKITYMEGESFNTNGMVVKATYSDGTTKEITDYTVTPSGVLTASNDSVRVAYTENGITKITTLAITVNKEETGGSDIDPDAEGIAYQLTGVFGDLVQYKIYHDIVMNLYNNGSVIAYSYNYLRDVMNTDSDGEYISAGTWSKSSFLGATNINLTMSYKSGEETKTQEESAPIAHDGSISCSLSIPIGSGRSVAMSGSDTVLYDTVDEFVEYCKNIHAD